MMEQRLTAIAVCNAHRRGFTVLEILIAFSILLVGAVSVYALFGRGLISHKRAVDSTNTAVLAGAVFDDIAANYDAYYYDRDRNGKPDLSAPDRNGNGFDDWLEPDGNSRVRYPIPYVRGYYYTIEYQRPQDPAYTQCLFVTLTVRLLNGPPDKAVDVFYRTVYIKTLPDSGG